MGLTGLTSLITFSGKSGGDRSGNTKLPMKPGVESAGNRGAAGVGLHLGERFREEISGEDGWGRKHLRLAERIESKLIQGKKICPPDSFHDFRSLKEGKAK